MRPVQRPGYCIELRDPTNANYVQIDSLGAIAGVTKFSVSYWVRTDVEPYGTTLSPLNRSQFSYTTNGAAVNGIYTQTGLATREKLLIGFTSAIYGETTAAMNVDPRLWQQVIVVYDGTLSGNANRCKLWVNGVSRALTFTGTVPASLVDPARTTAVVGYLPFYGQQTCGAFDELAIFNGYALSSTEVGTYSAKVSTDWHGGYRFTGVEPGLTNLFHFDEGVGVAPIDSKGSAVGSFVSTGASIPIYREGPVPRLALPGDA